MDSILFSIVLPHCLFADVQEVSFCTKMKSVPTSHQKVIEY